MANLNKVMFIGRLTRDVESRSFSNGGKVAKFGFAVNNRTRRDGQWVDEPVFLNVEAFNRGENGTLADRCERFLRKGSQCYVEGHLVLDQWTAQNGEKRSQIKVVMERLELLDGRQGDEGGRPSGGFSRGGASAGRDEGYEGSSGGPGYGESEDRPSMNDSDLPF